MDKKYTLKGQKNDITELLSGERKYSFITHKS